MKKFIFLILGLVCFSESQAQTIRRVNNNPGITGVNVYTSPQAAHDAAVANDILIIEPSVTLYGALLVNKPLKIYGSGYFLTTNTELRVDQRTSDLAYIILGNSASGSLIAGVNVLSYYEYVPALNIRFGITVAGANNITIQRCRVISAIGFINTNWGTSTDFNVSNIMITQSWVYTGVGHAPIYTAPSSGYTMSNVKISNNIIGGTGSINAGSVSQINNWSILNNTFTAGSIGNISNAVFENNLMSTQNSNTATLNNVSFSYNVSGGSSPFNGGIGNQVNYNIASEFIATGSGISEDEAYQIKAGSPLKTAGSGGTEVGAYGGPTPYVVSGIPAIPSIVNMVNTATGSSSAPISVTITVKSNN